MKGDTQRRRLGSIRELPSGRYFARIQQGHKVDGKPRVIFGTFDTRAEAEAWLVAKSVELDKRPDIHAGITLHALWDMYQATKQVTRKTMQCYAWYMDTVWLPKFGDGDAASITPQDVQVTLSTLTHSKAKHAKNALSSVLTHAVQRGALATNPIRGYRFEYPKRVVTDFDSDPFAAIERTRDVWSIDTVMRCFTLIRGLPLEPAWLCCVGAGLRVEEALALRKMDVRRTIVGGRDVTQLAVHAARTAVDGRKDAKTAQSVRVVGMLEPFGQRLWELVGELDEPESLLCPMSAANQNKRWRGYFEPSTSKHAPRKEGCNWRGRLAELSYLPLSKMRNTHVTIMAEAGVSDSINALMHGHTEMVERRHYLSPDMTDATIRVNDRLRLVI